MVEMVKKDELVAAFRRVEGFHALGQGNEPLMVKDVLEIIKDEVEVWNVEMGRHGRLIDVDKAVKPFSDNPGELFEGWEVAELLKEAPTVVARVEPRHGRWKTWAEAGNSIPSENRHECSECYEAAPVLLDGTELLSDYCPNCGAKMDRRW